MSHINKYETKNLKYKISFILNIKLVLSGRGCNDYLAVKSRRLV